jgi:hypothetical protein
MVERRKFGKGGGKMGMGDGNDFGFFFGGGDNNYEH